MIQLKGSEKQIKWAEKERTQILEWVQKRMDRSKDDNSKEYYETLKSKIENIDDCQFFIHSAGGFGFSMLKPGDKLGNELIKNYIDPFVKS